MAFSRAVMRRDTVELGIPTASAAWRKPRALTTSTNKAMSFKSSTFIAPSMDQSFRFWLLYREFALADDASTVNHRGSSHEPTLHPRPHRSPYLAQSPGYGADDPFAFRRRRHPQRSGGPLLRPARQRRLSHQ